MRRTFGLLMTGLALAASGLAPAAESLGKDLTATIVLHNMPCDKVTTAKRNSDSDYNATCQDGNKYHVYIDSAGHVAVQKL
jgi:hypothetical protein